MFPPLLRTLLLGALCAGACTVPAQDLERPRACASQVCAEILDEGLFSVHVRLSTPAGATLHNAWLASPASPPCRAGAALTQLKIGDVRHLHGPVAVGGTSDVLLAFMDAPAGVGTLDLDVRGSVGLACVRVPLHATRAGITHGR